MSDRVRVGFAEDEAVWLSVFRHSTEEVFSIELGNIVSEIDKRCVNGRSAKHPTHVNCVSPLVR